MVGWWEQEGGWEPTTRDLLQPRHPSVTAHMSTEQEVRTWYGNLNQLTIHVSADRSSEMPQANVPADLRNDGSDEAVRTMMIEGITAFISPQELYRTLYDDTRAGNVPLRKATFCLPPRFDSWSDEAHTHTMTVHLTFQMRGPCLWYAERVNSPAWRAYATTGFGLRISMDPRGRGRPGEWTLQNRAAERIGEEARTPDYRARGDGRIWPLPRGEMPEILRAAHQWRTNNQEAVATFIVPYLQSIQ